jgi:hypothetical protein
MIVIDPAYLPTHPSRGSRRSIVIFGTIAASLMGFALTLLMALLDTRIYERFDVERLELAPLLVIVPARRRSRG